MIRPDPFAEIRLTSLRTLRGANFWSSHPVARIDLAVGAYDEISSADVPGFTDVLAGAFPGLVEHRCSVGERGGFITRLRDGTYAPHIIEHIGLELQTVVGHDTGFGRARGGDRPGEYTVVFGYRHAEVGLRAAAHALEIVQRAFSGVPLAVEHTLAELRALAGQPAPPPLRQHVLCGVTGGAWRAEVRDEIAARRGGDELVVAVAPAYILNVGLPYSHCDVAVVLDADPLDVPPRYREPDRARQLASVVADAVPPHGSVVVPAHEREVQERIRKTGRRVAVFSPESKVPEDVARHADVVAHISHGRILIEGNDLRHDLGAPDSARPLNVQIATALALFLLEEARTAQRNP
ncbi:hypothetical protein BH23GEM3_BH23GEM3_08270 [soil metagenome]